MRDVIVNALRMILGVIVAIEGVVVMLALFSPTVELFNDASRLFNEDDFYFHALSYGPSFLFLVQLVALTWLVTRIMPKVHSKCGGYIHIEWERWPRLKFGRKPTEDWSWLDI